MRTHIFYSLCCMFVKLVFLADIMLHMKLVDVCLFFSYINMYTIQLLKLLTKAFLCLSTVFVFFFSHVNS